MDSNDRLIFKEGPVELGVYLWGSMLALHAQGSVPTPRAMNSPNTWLAGPRVDTGINQRLASLHSSAPELRCIRVALE